MESFSAFHWVKPDRCGLVVLFTTADFDQVAAYVRDLSEYHGASAANPVQNRVLTPVL